ncbi:cytochrome c oxidase assembly protein [Candidatus Hodgkinia cicadicola]
MAAASLSGALLYKQICARTGHAGATKRSFEHNNKLNDSKIKIRLIATTNEALPWLFKPSVDAINALPGETIKTSYTVKSLAGTPILGEATYNVTPYSASKYFNKIQCFCFSKISVSPLAKATLPLVFYIDPKISSNESTKNIKTITLMYNMNPVLKARTQYYKSR